MLGRIRTGARRLLHHFARPVRENEGGEGLVIEPYRGYGNSREIYLMGRVYRQPGGQVRSRELAGDLRGSLGRLLRWGVSGQAVTARFAGAEQRVVTDGDGYFHVRLRLDVPPPEDRLWHHVTLTLDLPSGHAASASAEVFVPPNRARFVVISDIDDTVMLTGVANKARMLWRLFAQGVESRVAFPGVAALYRALHGDEQNPILYVSRGPWAIYSMLDAFFQLHRIPIGPVIFLREWGVSLRSPLPRRAPTHKLDLIREMLSLYRELPFVLIGDSGQRDPEIYVRIVKEHPGRVLAIYIRNVSHEAARMEAIEELARQVLKAGSSLLLASDSVAMADHAAAHGLVPPETIRDVANEREAMGEDSPLHPMREVRRRTPGQTRRAVERGELEHTLKEGGEEPPNTLVEAGQDRTRPHRSPLRRSRE